MSSSGVGRGRGWLNLNKPQQCTSSIASRPGNLTSTSLVTAPVNHQVAVGMPSTETTQFSDVPGEFTDLIGILKQLNVNDDGILFNQKIKHLIENWNGDCQNAEDVEKSFEAIHQACMHDGDLATKLVLMIASRTFLSQEIHKQNIRLMFLRKLQNNFESSKQLQQSNPTAFRNSVQMLGEFYHKARLANGQQLTFMATPFLSYLEMLLESTHPTDLKLFTTQLYLNGASIKSETPDKVAEILNTVRLMLTTENQLNQDSRLWLLLAIDVANNRFGLLSSEVHKFYQEKLGDAAMASFQGSHGALSVQTTHASKTLDSYQSSVNVLQVSSPSDTSTEKNSSPPRTKELNNPSQNCGGGGFHNDSSQNSGANRWEMNNSTKPGPGRPILGAGARLHKTKSNDEAVQPSMNWRDNAGGGGWNSKQQKNASAWGDGKRGGTPRSSKGWEHDDRFETDYS